MSRKSDNDNRSNQLNPNNAEYWNCRGERRLGSDGEYDDDPKRHQSHWLRSNHVPTLERTERKQYYFAATTFDGTAVYVRFVIETQRGYIVSGLDSAYLAEAVKKTLFKFMRRKCSLGVAYWRLATDESRGEFYWYTSRFLFNDDDERVRLSKWNTAVRAQSQKLDLLFDWGKHEAAADLGVIKDETMTFGPESDDLLKWNKQQSA